MRLAAYCLTGALALSAQVPSLQTSAILPWRAAPALPWQMELPAPAPSPATAPPTQTAFALTVRLSPDGTLRITDDKGLVRMKLGLPGRPLKAWRDWGSPIPDLGAPLPFPQHSPLQRGIGGMPVGAPDFRPALEGLLWILTDDEAILTVVHPATSQVVFLPLPSGQDLDIAFYPDRLEAVERGPNGSGWALHWLALLPEFIQLGKDAAAGKPKGTALLPFPKD